MKERNLKRLCPVCGESQGEILTHVHMVLGDGIKIPNQYNVVCCENCGFTFADANANQDVYNEYYASDNCYSCEGDIKALEKNISIAYMRDFLLKHVKKDENILDIGCGSGDLLKALKEAGYMKLTGMDPSQESVNRLLEASINGIRRNIFDVVDDNVAKYSTIVSTCVMEHIWDLNMFVDRALQYMAPNGKFYIVVPAVEGFKKYYQAKPNYFNHEHINYFSKMSLKNLMLKHNMSSMTMNNGEYYCVADDHGNQDLMIQNIFEANTEKKEEIEYDFASKESIKQYIDMNNEVEKKIDAFIEKAENEKRRIVVWGAGSLAMSLMVNDKFAKYVDGFIDNNITKTGKNIMKKEVFAPEVLKEDKFKNHLIFVACMRSSDSILRQIDDMGISNEVIVY